jgi:hypothetical protein
MPYRFHFAQRFIEKVNILIKCFLSIIYNFLLFQFYDIILVYDPYTYIFAKRIFRRVLYVLPYISHNLEPEAYQNSCEKYSNSVVAIISVEREDKIAAKYEKLYFKILSLMALLTQKITFVIIGSSEEDLRNVLYNFPKNIIAIGKKMGKDYLLPLLCSKAVFVYIGMPGASNRIGDAIACGKAVITSPIGAQFHPGLKHFSTAIIMEPCLRSIKMVIDILENKDYELKNMGKRIKLLHQIYFLYNFRILKDLFNQFENTKNINNE